MLRTSFIYIFITIDHGYDENGGLMPVRAYYLKLVDRTTTYVSSLGTRLVSDDGESSESNAR